MPKVFTPPILIRPPTRCDQSQAVCRFLGDLTRVVQEALNRLAYSANQALNRYDTEPMGVPLMLASSTVAGLSAFPAASWPNGLLYITDEAGGAVPAFSDGADWRRVTDRAVVS